MGRDHCRQPGIAHQRHQRIEHPVGCFGVEVPRRLIGQQQGRLIGQRAAEGDTLLFAP